MNYVNVYNSTEKEDFILNYEHIKGYVEKPTILILIISMPTGAKEVITNYSMLDEKVEYIKNAYDDDLRLKSCSDIKIIDWLIV